MRLHILFGAGLDSPCAFKGEDLLGPLPRWSRDLCSARRRSVFGNDPWVPVSGRAKSTSCLVPRNDSVASPKTVPLSTAREAGLTSGYQPVWCIPGVGEVPVLDVNWNVSCRPRWTSGFDHPEAFPPDERVCFDANMF